jgi:DNA-binding response OmpR family regulator
MTTRRGPTRQEEPATEPTRTAAQLASGVLKRPRILLAEDDDEMRALLAWLLRRDHYDVIECVDGLDLASKLGTFMPLRQPAGLDLVISDVCMPGVTALEILESMRGREDLPPVILVTAFGDAYSHSEAARLGAAALFDKPFEMRDLLAKVRELLDEGRTRVPRGPAQVPSPASSTRCPGHRAAAQSGSANDDGAEPGGKQKR